MLTLASPIRRLGLVAAVAFLAAACGSSATPVPTPAPTPVPTPAPTPTPVDVAAVVLDTVQADDYSASFAIKGTGTFAGQALTETGTWDTAGGDSHAAMNITMGTDSWTTDSIEVGGKTWESNAGGPYIPNASTCATMTDALGLAKSLKDEGTVSKNGQTVHHLTIVGGVDPSCSAPTSTSMLDMKLTIDLYATDAGDLTAIDQTASWSQMSGGQSFSATTTTEATPTGKAAGAITAPAGAWSLYEDPTYHFRVGVPAGWDEETYQGRPSLRDADHKYIVEFVVDTAPAGTTLADHGKAVRAGLATLTAFKMNTTKDVDLGGEAAGLFEFHYTSEGTPLYSLYVYSLHGGNSFDVFWASAPGAEKADYAMFTNIVNSFVFTH
jgi:hypothetical protein